MSRIEEKSTSSTACVKSDSRAPSPTQAQHCENQHVDLFAVSKGPRIWEKQLNLHHHFSHVRNYLKFTDWHLALAKQLHKHLQRFDFK